MACMIDLYWVALGHVKLNLINLKNAHSLIFPPVYAHLYFLSFEMKVHLCKYKEKLVTEPAVQLYPEFISTEKGS